MDIKRWQEFSLAQQMGNIASEVSRAYSFEKNRDFEQKKMSLERVLEMIDATIDDKRYFGRLKEICLLREIIADFYSQTGNYSVTLPDILHYLMPFALAARR